MNNFFKVLMPNVKKKRYEKWQKKLTLYKIVILKYLLLIMAKRN